MPLRAKKPGVLPVINTFGKQPQSRQITRQLGRAALSLWTRPDLLLHVEVTGLPTQKMQLPGIQVALGQEEGRLRPTVSTAPGPGAAYLPVSATGEEICMTTPTYRPL